MDLSIIVAVLNAAILLLGLLGGSAIWIKVKAVANALAESGDVTTRLRDAIRDDKLTTEEVEAIVKEINEAKGAWENVFVTVK
jgi:uncharacterized protein YneF (UPF0154 family)